MAIKKVKDSVCTVIMYGNKALKGRNLMSQ